MKAKAGLLCITACALTTIGWSQTTATSGAAAPHYSRMQLKAMEQEAHTPDQYKVLASYYSERQTTYLAKAAEAKQEWDRRSGNTMLTASKYPRPVDSAHYLYDYYATVAREAEQTALKYKQLAASQSGVN